MFFEDFDEPIDESNAIDDEDEDDFDEDREPSGRRRRRVRSGPRPRVFSMRKLKPIVAQEKLLWPSALAEAREHRADRPRTRGDCRGHEGPCPWISCKFHLYLSVNPESGAITINFPDKEPWELAETCALDVAERGGVTLEETGILTNVTRERVRQIEVRGLIKLGPEAKKMLGRVL